MTIIEHKKGYGGIHLDADAEGQIVRLDKTLWKIEITENRIHIHPKKAENNEKEA